MLATWSRVCDMWDTDKIVMYVGNTSPSLFVDCYAAVSGNVTGVLLRGGLVQRGLLVTGDSA